MGGEKQSRNVGPCAPRRFHHVLRFVWSIFLVLSGGDVNLALPHSSGRLLRIRWVWGQWSPYEQLRWLVEAVKFFLEGFPSTVSIVGVSDDRSHFLRCEVA